jgi:hypothetical protein
VINSSSRKSECPLTSNDRPEWRVTNIYSTVPQLVFKLMHRGVGVTEICDDPKLFHWTYRIYRKFEKTTSNAHIVFPWLYTPSHVWRLFLATRLYLDVTRILTKRKKEERREDDAMQYLMDKGESMHTIVEVSLLVNLAYEPRLISEPHIVRFHHVCSRADDYILHVRMAPIIFGQASRVERALQTGDQQHRSSSPHEPVSNP